MTPTQLQYALLLLARQQGGEHDVASAATAALQRWRSADEVHERAYQVALQAWRGTDANGLQDVIGLPSVQAPRRRKTLQRGVLTALGLASFAITGRRWWPDPVDRLQIITTEQGQIRTIALADGSRIDIGAVTTLRLRETAHVREVFLAVGDTRLSVTKDTKRPFLLTTIFGRVTVIGTEFSVSATPDSMYVAVNKGKVRVQADRTALFHQHRTGAPFDHAGMSKEIILLPGNAIDVDQNGLGQLSHIATDTVGAWRDRWMIFDKEPLLAAITRWNRYTQDVIRVQDADRNGLRGLHITGSFGFADQSAFLESLPRILPVKLTRQNGMVWIARR